MKSEKAARIIARQSSQEELKEKPKEVEASATCVIEIQAVREYRGTESRQESKDKIAAHCVSFSYKDKSSKKLDLEKSYMKHFHAWKTLLHPWVDLN